VAGRNGAVVRRMQLGRILRELREQAGLSLEVAAPALDWSSSKLSRIENGHRASTCTVWSGDWKSVGEVDLEDVEC